MEKGQARVALAPFGSDGRPYRPCPFFSALKEELQSELQVAGTDRSVHYPGRDAGRVSPVAPVTGFIDSAAREYIGGVSVHSEDRRVERVDGIEAELEVASFVQGEALRETHVDLFESGAALARD